MKGYSKYQSLIICLYLIKPVSLDPFSRSRDCSLITLTFPGKYLRSLTVPSIQSRSIHPLRMRFSTCYSAQC